MTIDKTIIMERCKMIEEVLVLIAFTCALAFIHELGHFMLARMLGFGSVSIGISFGPDVLHIGLYCRYTYTHLVHAELWKCQIVSFGGFFSTLPTLFVTRGWPLVVSLLIVLYGFFEGLVGLLFFLFFGVV